MAKKETITNQHYNGWDPECGVEFTCSNCWEVCLRQDYKFCPFCGVELIWDIDGKYKFLQEQPELKCHVCGAFYGENHLDICSVGNGPVKI